ncbi:MAG: [LysW]-lysine hydrolase [Anaerolineae bacterium]|jgi:LysW-gamma-L-lysine carboxypeptidase
MDEIAFLKAMLSIQSPSGEEDAVATYLLGEMTSLGFQTHQDEVGNVVGVIGDPEAEREIVLLGHMDTVAGLIPLRERAGRIYARGAVDAKGPLAAFVLAAARTGPQLRGTRLVVIGSVEEEAHGRGARHLAKTRSAPFCTIIGEPSSWEGITVGYKGMLSLDYRGLQPGAHSAGQQVGPAEKAVTVWNKLMLYAEERNQGEFGRFNTLDPALRDFCTFSDGLNEGVNMNIAVRLPPGLEASTLEQKIRSWCNGAHLKFYPSDPPFETCKNTPVVRAMLRAIRAEGGRPRFKLKTGTSDMNIVGPAWGCAIVAYGPGDSSLDHTPEEHIEIAEFRRGTDVLSRALGTLAA